MSISQDIPDMKPFGSDDDLSPRVQSLSASSTSDSRSILFGSISSLNSSAEIPDSLQFPQSLYYPQDDEMEYFSTPKKTNFPPKPESPECPPESGQQSLTPSKMQMIVYPQEQISKGKKPHKKKKAQEKDVPLYALILSQSDILRFSLYIKTQLYSTHTLADWLSSRQSVTVEKNIPMFSQLCTGLQYIHAQGCVVRGYASKKN